MPTGLSPYASTKYSISMSTEDRAVGELQIRQVMQSATRTSPGWSSRTLETAIPVIPFFVHPHSKFLLVTSMSIFMATYSPSVRVTDYIDSDKRVRRVQYR